MRLPNITAPQPELVFRKSETDRFLEELGLAFRSLSEAEASALYEKVKAQKGFTITYDSELLASLICVPAGDGQINMIPIPGESQVLRKIGASLLARSDQLQGEQVILTNARAFLPFESGMLITCEWMWLGDPLIESAIVMLEDLLSDEN